MTAVVADVANSSGVNNDAVAMNNSMERTLLIENLYLWYWSVTVVDTLGNNAYGIMWV